MLDTIGTNSLFTHLSAAIGFASTCLVSAIALKQLQLLSPYAAVRNAFWSTAASLSAPLVKNIIVLPSDTLDPNGLISNLTDSFITVSLYATSIFLLYYIIIQLSTIPPAPAAPAPAPVQLEN